MHAWRTWVLAAVVAAGCSKSGDTSPARAALTAEERAELGGMAKSLEAIASVVDSSRQAVLLSAAYGEVSGKRCYADAANADPSQRMSILVKCGILCPAAMQETPKLEPRARWAAAVKLCGPEHYGLKPGQEYLGSMELAIVAEVAAWYAPLRARLADDDPLAKALDAASARTAIVLPLPASGPLTLPASRAVLNVEHGLYLVVTADKLTGGRMPCVRLGRQGVEWLEPDALFPGLAAKPAELAAAARARGDERRRDLSPEPPPPPPAATATPDAGPAGGRRFGEEGKMGKPDAERHWGQGQMRERAQAGILGVLKAQNRRAFARLTGDVGRPGEAVLVLADESLPVGRLWSALGELAGGWADLGVSGPSAQASAHGLTLVVPRPSPTSGPAAASEPAAELPPLVEVSVTFGDEGVTLALSTGERKSFGPGENDALTVHLRELNAVHERDDIVLIASGQRPVKDLVAVMDMLYSEGVRFAVVHQPGDGSLLPEIPEGPIGHGGVGQGHGASGIGARPHGKPSVTEGDATTVGELDKTIIRRYMRSKRANFEYCYEKRLMVKPKLQGTVTVQFFIVGGGQVVTAAASGMDDDELHACVAQVVRAIEFPRTEHGGGVQVSYPLTFKPPE